MLSHEPAAAAALAAAIPRLAKASVLVVGDAMLDRYVFGSVTRISPEAPVPVLTVAREVALPGGAGNVVRNLTALGAAAAFVSVVGDDQAGSDLTGLIGGQLNVEPWLLVQGSRCTTVKTRFIADGQQLLRSDQEIVAPVHHKLAERLVRIAEDALTATTVTVLSDYDKGVLAGTTAGKIIAAAKSTGRPVVVDPRGRDYDRFNGADVLVPTVRGVEAATGMAIGTEAQLAAAAGWLRTAHGFGAVAVNRRAGGFLLVTAAGAVSIPAWPGEMFDFTGTGDTAVAAIAAGLAAGLTLELSVRIAALAVGLCAARPGMAVARAADLLAVLTPQGRALRKILATEAAAEQVALWRRAGLRTGLVAGAVDDSAAARLRAHCDRLVVLLGAAEAAAQAEVAALAAVDLVCAGVDDALAATLNALRPDLLLQDADDAVLSALLAGWGGKLVTAN
jgi:D-beta-D-heptose 7-phosphate kinase/D-beta-D-heptose 1-phosphate adenosyltransferase